MIPYTKELGEKMRHGLKRIGKKYVFSVRDLIPGDAGLYQVDVEDVNMFSTDFKSEFYIWTTHIKKCKVFNALHNTAQIKILIMLLLSITYI